MANNLSQLSPRVGVTKAPFVNFSVMEIFDFAKVPVKYECNIQ